MAVEWQLQAVMQDRGIRNASQLQAAMADRLGIQISRVALDKLLKKAPAQIRLETAQYLCTLLQVPLESLLIITPEALIRQPVLIQPFGKSSQTSEPFMVDPSQFF
ncbi:helix-turn-helix domain-containing protein [Vampirovibrio sp.]|uniref:helix-turn-helix domain-containing protein n=1 Tax=Vampirovibrio sp. TaxID=2717857 RepID=UPI003593DF40